MAKIKYQLGILISTIIALGASSPKACAQKKGGTGSAVGGGVSAPPTTAGTSSPGSPGGTSTPSTQILTVIADEGGIVTVAGNSCSGTCSYSFAEGSFVTLTAIPMAGYDFDGWGGGGEGGGGECDSEDGNVCIMEMDQTKTIEAYFFVEE